MLLSQSPTGWLPSGARHSLESSKHRIVPDPLYSLLQHSPLKGNRMVEEMKNYAMKYRRDPDDDARLVEIEDMPNMHTFGRILSAMALTMPEKPSR